MTHLVAFTGNGAALCRRLRSMLPDSSGYAPLRYAEKLLPLETSVGQWAEERFHTGECLVFIGAIGIAVRAVAPLVEAKDRDPAVLCIPENGRYVIPLLSGHIGGANRLAREIATFLGATPIITTATDLNGIFAFDEWAAQSGFVVGNPDAIKEISGALLRGDTVGFQSDFPVEGPLPSGVEYASRGDCGVLVSLNNSKPFLHTLHLIPRCLVVGVGCRKDIVPGRLKKFMEKVFHQAGFPMNAIAAIATIDRKQEEPAIVQLLEHCNVPPLIYSAEELASAQGDFSASLFVREITGVDNVCERSAMMTAHRLLIPKTAQEGMTIAVALREPVVRFELDLDRETEVNS